MLRLVACLKMFGMSFELMLGQQQRTDTVTAASDSVALMGRFQEFKS